MILADSSVWIAHFRSNSSTLRQQLSAGQVLMHSMIIGELACGNLRQRSRVLNGISMMRTVVHAHDDEVLRLIEDHKLWGSGIGWIDANLIASALLSQCQLWTRDRRLQGAASRAGAAVFAVPSEDILQ